MKLHLVNDEKIINRTIDMFEAVFPGENLFVVDSKKPVFKWVRNNGPVISMSEFRRTYGGARYEAVYIHYLNRRKMNMVNRLDLSGSKVYWIIWGADLYNKLLAPRGFRLYAKDTWGDRQPVGRLDRWLKKMRAERNRRFISRKVDYIVTDTTDNDYAYLLKYYPELKDKEWRDFFYYPIDVILGPQLLHSKTTGNGIMIGNSASVTNNHQSVIRQLSELDLGGRKVTVPLSYNGNPEYIKAVCETGQSHLGKLFNPLMEFMPLEEYNLLQASTGYAFFGNLRQEAIGNILIVLYLGAKVFLYPANPVYEWALSKGLKVFDLSKLSQADIDTPLDGESRLSNRTILLDLYSRDRLATLINGLSPRKTIR